MSRTTVLTLATVVLVAGVAAGVGFVVGRSTPTGVVSAEAAVADITTTLLGGRTTTGVGMIVSGSGQVLTNSHVVEGATSISARVGGSGTPYAAIVLGLDPTDDVALLQLIRASSLPTVTIGDSSRVAVGDPVTSVGNATGPGRPAETNVGAITALNQNLTEADANGANAETLTGVLLFSAPVRNADCGGPLLDRSGKVIGMATAGAERARLSTAGAGAGYAIPINIAMGIARQITSGAPNPNILRSKGALLGIDVQDRTTPPGILVVGVSRGGPADQAGLAADDVIVAVDGAAVGTVTELRLALAGHVAGDHVVIEWVDPSGRHHEATAQLAPATTP